MALRDFKKLVSAKWDEGKFLCIGLDSDFRKIPEHLKKLGPREGITAFNVALVEATKDIAAAYKPNSAFYEAHGEDGWAALSATCEEIRALAPDIPIILDAKRGDIGNTNDGYVTAIFDLLGADAVTVHPYMGKVSLSPFLERKEKGVIVLCRTSNGGSGEFQNLIAKDEPLYKTIARNISEKWNDNGNCGLVVGATYPKEIAEVRAVAKKLPILVPGIGMQGGDIEKSVQAAVDAEGRGMWLSASRSVIFAASGENFAERARECAQDIHSAIQKAL